MPPRRTKQHRQQNHKNKKEDGDRYTVLIYHPDRRILPHRFHLGHEVFFLFGHEQTPFEVKPHHVPRRNLARRQADRHRAPEPLETLLKRSCGPLVFGELHGARGVKDRGFIFEEVEPALEEVLFRGRRRD